MRGQFYCPFLLGPQQAGRSVKPVADRLPAEGRQGSKAKRPVRSKAQPESSPGQTSPERLGLRAPGDGVFTCAL